mgnify:CR=1 FL=1
MIRPIKDPDHSNATPEKLLEYMLDGVELGEGNTLDPTAKVPTYEKAGNEVFYPEKTGPGKYVNAYITIGYDRPAHIFSGYGGQGGNACSTIDICAGAASSLRTASSGGKESYGRENVIGKIFASDASRIYISQMTDVDANFGLPLGNHADTKGGAAIAVKSDHIRIIGRTSIKLYAGAGSFENLGLTGEKNAQNGQLGSARTIELIASDVRTLQPIVKGNNLLKCLSNIYGHIAKLYQRDIENNASIMTLRTSQIAHFHPSTPVVTFPDPIGAVMGMTGLSNEVSTVINNVMSTFSSEIDKSSFLGISPDLIESTVPEFSIPGAPPTGQTVASLKGEDYILSSNVFCT